MKPKQFLILAFASLSLILTTRADQRPNIIFIYTDDHGWPDIGPAGIYKDLKTPHLDRLAASGIRASNGYSTAPQCVPSRAGFLTGKYQNRFGVEANGRPLDGFDDEQTVAERLKQAGYTTAQIGKWHLGPGNAIDQHGFDYFYNKNRNAPAPANFNRDGQKISTGLLPHTSYHLDDCTSMAVTFIRKHQDDPFFLYLAYRAPHVPLDAPEKYLDRFPGEMPERRRQALAMIAAMDDGVGAIVSELKDLDLTKKTLIFYIGDNGAPLKIHKIDAPGGGPGWDGSLNEPMNGEKGMLTEGGIRVPFLISWPGTLPSGAQYDSPIIAIDATATALHLAGINEDSLDGINLIPHLKNNTAPDRTLYWRWISQAAVREGRWKFLQGGSRHYLFDLESDPGERNNLASEKPELASKLHRKLVTWANDLQPAGLQTDEMAETWKRYFDHYLDGKKSSKPSTNRSKNISSKATVRNAQHQFRQGALHITPSEGSQSQPFLVANPVKLTGSFTATVSILSEKGGKLDISWRPNGSKRFQTAASTSVELTASPKWQSYTLKVPARESTTHLRFLLPKHSVKIGEITLKDQTESFTWIPGKS